MIDSLHRPAPDAADLVSPPAQRLRRARWADPRLVLGVVFVLGSVVIGSVVVARADRTVAVWAVADDAGLAPGQPVEADDLRAVAVGPGSLDLGRYVAVGPEGSYPGGYVATRSVGPGELLPRAALGRPDALDVRYVTVPVPRQELPAGMAAGGRVDLWAAPAGVATGVDESPRSVLLLAGVSVVDVDRDGGALGVAGDMVPVTLALPTMAPGTAAAEGPTAAPVADPTADLLAAARTGTLYLTSAAGVATP